MARTKKRRRKRSAAPRLLAASGAQIELAAGREYVLGRDRECDIVLDDLLSSRRHARLAVGEEVAITDLESRNGTFVDDVRIAGETPLAHGSRVRVGTTVYLLSTATKRAHDPLLDTGTVALDSLAADPAFGEGVLGGEGAPGGLAGKLGGFSLVDVLQGLMQAGQSGTLHVALPLCHARVEVRRGEVVGAVCGGQSGLEALVALAREKVGVFWLEETSAECARTIDEPQGRLLYVLCRALQ